MASSAVTQSRRKAGWNVAFLAGRSHTPFAGVFSPADCDLLTFNDVIREMRLCFEFQSATRDNDYWEDISFGLVDPSGYTGPCPLLVQNLDTAVPSLPSPNLKRPNILRFRMVRHTRCDLPQGSPLAVHLNAKCAQPVPEPVRRREPRYLPPRTTSSDPRFAIMPHRRALKSRTGSLSPKRPRSGSTSPTKDGSADADEVDVSEMVVPATMDLALAKARQYAAAFRTSCLDSSNVCAVSGKGQSWYFNSDIGPALQACHIVEQKHYHLYPRDDCDDDEEYLDSARRLQHLWERTWSSRNGILLLSHLHELFDARLLSIHPDSHIIRAFVPYDVIIEFHGREAILPREVDREALRHHYDMCCIENMAAQFPFIDMPFNESRGTSGTQTATITKTDLPITPSTGDPGSAGDPFKRWRPALQDRNLPPGQREAEDETEILTRLGDGGGKRRKLDNCELKVEFGHDRFQADSFITPWNSNYFLADVNWELQRLKTAELR